MINRLLILLIGIAFVGCATDEEIITLHYPNGSVESEVTYVNGKKNGKFIFYRPDGKNSKKWKEGSFLNDNIDPDAVMIYYAKNGVDTALVSIWKNGSVLIHREYKDGLIDFENDHSKKLIIVYDKLGNAVDSTLYENNEN